MGFVDFILNIAGLLLWLNWRTTRLNAAGRKPSTLAGTLRRAESPRFKPWHLPAALCGVILLRALVYWKIGSAVNWSATLGVPPISISFRSEYFTQMLLFSILSFAVLLAAFLMWLLFLSLLARPTAELDTIRRFVHLHLGPVASWPGVMKLLLPFVLASVLWWLLTWVLVYWMVLPPISQLQRLEQALTIGLGSYLAWKYVIVAVLLLHTVNSYVHLGNHPFWRNIHPLAQRILSLLKRLPLQLGRIDLAPLVMIALVFLLTHVVENGSFVKMPFSNNPPLFKIPGLVDVYRWTAK
jgi:uncharacterized protein YggT (Ycf19 family)